MEITLLKGLEPVN